MRKYWTKPRLETSWADSKFSTSMSDASCFSDLQFLSALLTAPHFSPGLVLNPASSSPGQVPHNPVIILESSIQSRLHLHSFMRWPLWASLPGRPWHTPGLSHLPYQRREIPHPLSHILDSKSRTKCLSCHVLLLAGLEVIVFIRLQLSWFDGSFYCLSFSLPFQTLEAQLGGVWPRGHHTLFISFSIRFSFNFLSLWAPDLALSLLKLSIW